MDILEISREIFTKPVKSKNSIQLDFSELNISTDELFKELLIMFREGMLILFGNGNGRVELSNLTETDFFKIKEYFNSFGVDITYEVTSPNDIDVLNRYNNKRKDSLNDYYLRIVSNVNGRAYYISFAMLV